MQTFHDGVPKIIWNFKIFFHPAVVPLINECSLIRHYVPRHILKQVYYGQFHSHITYACQEWGLSLPSNSPIITAQKRSVRLMTFSPPLEHTPPIFKDLKILKIENVIKMQHVILAHKILSKNSPRVLYGKLDIVELQNDLTRNLPSSRFSILPGYIYAINSCPFWEKVSKAWNSLLKEINN